MQHRLALSRGDFNAICERLQGRLEDSDYELEPHRLDKKAKRLELKRKQKTLELERQHTLDVKREAQKFEEEREARWDRMILQAKERPELKGEVLRLAETLPTKLYRRVLLELEGKPSNLHVFLNGNNKTVSSVKFPEKHPIYIS